MLARNSSLTHPSGVPLELPLLVPSFSSKGFILHTVKDGPDGVEQDYSEIAYWLQEFGSLPHCSALISAYDLHFGHFEAPKMTCRDPISHLQNVPLVMLDSGGYELRSDFDSTEPKRHSYQSKPGYGEAEYLEVLRDLQTRPECPHLIVTSFDHGLKNQELEDQISNARGLFDKVSGHLTNLIVKPFSKGGDFIQANLLDVTLLRNIDVIGFTEKELGSDLSTRVKTIATIRKKMDEEGITAPIHIWGGLDPVLTPLYFFAGAEIFDGISWLRYAYRHGMAIYRNCYSVLHPDCGIDTKSETNDYLVNQHNLLFLDNLSNNLQLWVDYGGEKFDMFDPTVADRLEKSYEIMQSKIPILKEA